MSLFTFSIRQEIQKLEPDASVFGFGEEVFGLRLAPYPEICFVERAGFLPSLEQIQSPLPMPPAFYFYSMMTSV